MPRGGKRPGAGRPSKIQGAAHRYEIYVDDPSQLGAMEYSADYDVTIQDAVRELLAAWHQSPAVRATVETWRRAREGAKTEQPLPTRPAREKRRAP